MSRPEWIEVGRVSRPHGVHGEVRIVPTTDNPERFTPDSVLYARPGRLGVAGPRLREQMRLTVSTVRGEESFPILSFTQVLDRDAAEALRGYVLEVRSNQLPELDEDEFYPFDLIGLEVRDESGSVVGLVRDVLDSPAHALLLITGSSVSADSVSQDPVLSGGPGPTGGLGAVEGPGVAGKLGTGEELIPFVQAAVPVVALAEGYLVLASGFLQGLSAPEPKAQDCAHSG